MNNYIIIGGAAILVGLLLFGSKTKGKNKEKLVIDPAAKLPLKYESGFVGKNDIPTQPYVMIVQRWANVQQPPATVLLDVDGMWGRLTEARMKQLGYDRVDETTLQSMYNQIN